MLGRCRNCEDKWLLFLQEESKINNMSNSEKPKEVKDAPEAPKATPQEQVAKSQRVDVNKVIEDRRKAAQGGKTINK